MEIIMKFINCTSYDFKAENGTRYVGFTCRCFDPATEAIVKCKADHLLDYQFGDDVTVNAVPNGRYLNYHVS